MVRYTFGTTSRRFAGWRWSTRGCCSRISPRPLRDYDEVSADIVRRSGGVLYAGPILADLGGRCVRVTVRASTAATVYLFNVRLWLADSRRDEVDDPQLVELEAALSQLERADDRRPLSWIVRQIAIPADG